MKSNLLKALVLGTLVSNSLLITEIAFAKRTAAEQAIKDSDKAAKKASKSEKEVKQGDDNSSTKSQKETEKLAKKAAKEIEKAAKKSGSATSSRVELMARAKLDEVAQQDEAVQIEEGREANVRYRSKDGKHELHIRVERFALGSQFAVAINGVHVANIESIQKTEGIEAAVDFSDSNWPQGLSLELNAGMVVQIVDESNSLILNDVLAVK